MRRAISWLTDGPKQAFGLQPVFLIPTTLLALLLPELARQPGDFVMFRHDLKQGVVGSLHS
jgi:hypothetical protein